MIIFSRFTKVSYGNSTIYDHNQSIYSGIDRAIAFACPVCKDAPSARILPIDKRSPAVSNGPTLPLHETTLNPAAAIVDIAAVRKYASGVHAALENLAGKSFAAIDPVLHELLRLRIATLAGNATQAARRTPGIALSEEKIAALPQWPKSPLYSVAERAVLEFAEQYYINVAGMTDAMVGELAKHYDSSTIFAIVHAIYTIDGAQRTQVLLDRLLTD